VAKSGNPIGSLEEQTSWPNRRLAWLEKFNLPRIHSGAISKLGILRHPLLSFVKPRVVTGIIPCHHQVLQGRIVNCSASGMSLVLKTQEPVATFA
jgi:hypothetical protein